MNQDYAELWNVVDGHLFAGWTATQVVIALREIADELAGVGPVHKEDD